MLIHYGSQNNKKFITHGKVIKLIELSDMLYITGESHLITIHTSNQEPVKEVSSLSTFLKENGQYGFFKINKNLVVNIKNVTEFSHENNQLYIRFGEKYCKIVKSGFQNYKKLLLILSAQE